MEWLLWVVLGLVALGLAARVIINVGRVARRVRKLSRFAYGRRPDVFREPLGWDVTNVIDEANKMTPVHFDLAVLYLLMEHGRATAEGQAIALEVLSAWDGAWARGTDQW